MSDALSRSEDRSGRLTVFGALAMLAGAGLILLALFYLAVPFLGILPENAVRWPSILVGALTYALLGAVFIAAGIGSVRRRRWVRPVMLVLAWSWLLAGALLLGFAALMLDEMLLVATADGPAPAAEVLALVKIVLMIAIGVGGVALPALFVWVYNDRSVQVTCDRANPGRDWTDGRPTSVLGLSLGLAAAGVFALPMAINPVLPVFGWFVLGWPGAVGTVIGAVACGIVAWWCFRMEPRGWWGATTLLTLLGASTAVTFAVADAERVREALARFGGEELGLGDSGPVLVWGTVLITALSVAYLLAIRHHFVGRS